MKNKLTELLLNIPDSEVEIDGVKVGKRLHTAESVAEYLISKGVIVPPVNVGDTLYAAILPIFDGDPEPYVEEWTATGIAYEGDGKWYVENVDGEMFELGTDLCNLTYEEAKKYINELMVNKQ